MLPTLFNIKLACIIISLVSSSGDSINVNHLHKLEKLDNGGCKVYQYYNPSVIISDWSCDEVESEIMFNIFKGCNENNT